MAGHTLKEEQSSLLVEDGVWGSTSVTGDILFNVSPKNILYVLLLEATFHDELVATIDSSTGSQLGKEKS